MMQREPGAPITGCQSQVRVLHVTRPPPALVCRPAFRRPRLGKSVPTCNPTQGQHAKLVQQFDQLFKECAAKHKLVLHLIEDRHIRCYNLTLAQFSLNNYIIKPRLASIERTVLIVYVFKLKILLLIFKDFCPACGEFSINALIALCRLLSQQVAP